MREAILNNLTSGKDAYNELLANYSNVLPQNIIDGAVKNYNSDLLRHVNNFLSILNMAEQENKYVDVKNVDQAIETFSNEEIQNSIDKSLENKTIVGVGGNGGNLSAKEMLEASKFGIDSGVQLIILQLKAGKLSNGEF